MKNKRVNVSLLAFMKFKLRKKYNILKDFYNKKKINELIFNDPSSYTAAFKEYLLLEDENEFLRRFYRKNELPKKLNNIFNFYAKYSKIFPNYIIIQESKYMYKNIQKKQKMIDNLQNIKNQERRNKERNKNTSNDTIFTNGAINDIFNQTDSFYKNNLKNLIDITFTNQDTVKDLNNLIDTIEKNETNKKTSYINLVVNKNSNNFNSDFSTIIQSPRKESSKKLRNTHSNISVPAFTDYLLNKNNNTIKKHEIPTQKYPTIGASNSKKKLIIHQKINSQNIISSNSNLKKKILQLDNKNFNNNLQSNLDSIKFIKMLSILDKKHKTKNKENFSTSSNMSSSRQKPFNKYSSSNSSNKKMSTLTSSPRNNNFLTERLEQKLFSKKVFSRNHNNSKKKSLIFHNSVLTDNLANYTKNKLLFDQSTKLKIKKNLRFFNQK